MSSIDVSQPFDRLFGQIVERLNNLHKLPTIAAPEDIEVALKSLPGTLPDTGSGVEEAVDYVERVIIPGLAPGHAGPR